MCSSSCFKSGALDRWAPAPPRKLVTKETDPLQNFQKASRRLTSHGSIGPQHVWNSSRRFTLVGLSTCCWAFPCCDISPCCLSCATAANSLKFCSIVNYLGKFFFLFGIMNQFSDLESDNVASNPVGFLFGFESCQFLFWLVLAFAVSSSPAGLHHTGRTGRIELFQKEKRSI